MALCLQLHMLVLAAAVKRIMRVLCSKPMSQHLACSKQQQKMQTSIPQLMCRQTVSKQGQSYKSSSNSSSKQEHCKGVAARLKHQSRKGSVPDFVYSPELWFAAPADPHLQTQKQLHTMCQLLT